MAKQTKWTIYCHIHRESGRRYVGLTKATWRQRWNRHVYSAKRGKGSPGFSHFANAIRKYGKDAFSHEVLEVCHSLEEANGREQYWIDLYDTRNPLRGFNLAPGGAHVPHSTRNPWNRPEYRERVSASIKARWKDPKIRAQNIAASTAALRSPEVRVRCAEVQRGKILTQEHREKISANMSAVQRSKSREELSEQSRNMQAGKQKRRASVTEVELRAAKERHSAASLRGDKISATRTPSALAAHRESCRRRSKYASIDVQAVLHMLNEGMTKASIADRLGVDRGTLHRALVEAGTGSLAQAGAP